MVLGAAVVVLTLHAAGSVVALWVLPQGAEAPSPAWLANVALPIGAAALLGLVLASFVFFKRSALGVSLMAAAIAGAWLGGSVAAAMMFPRSIGFERAIGPFAIGLSLGGLAWATRLRLSLSLAFLLLGGTVGAAQLTSRRAVPAGTRPSGGELAKVEGAPTVDDATSGQVSFPCGREHVRVAPLLAVEGVTLDGAWPGLALAKAQPSRRKFEAFAKDKSGFRARYSGDGDATVVATKDARGLEIDAVTTVPSPVFAQRALLASVHIPFAANVILAPFGKEPLALGETGVRVWYGRDMQLHLSKPLGKAPLRPAFQELMRAPLGRDEPLVVDVQHRDVTDPKSTIATSCRLVFKDWTSQLSALPSPIAPVAQNAIVVVALEASTVIALVLAEGPQPAAITLAAGTYRNRIRVDTTMQSSPTDRPNK